MKTIFDEFKKLQYAKLQKTKALTDIEHRPLKMRIGLQIYLIEQFFIHHGLSLSIDDLSWVFYDELTISTLDELRSLPFESLKDFSLNEKQIETVAPLVSAHYEDDRRWHEMSKQGFEWKDIARIVK